MTFPLNIEWRMKSIFHQDEMPEEYKANLGRREGRTAEKDLDKYQRSDKPFVDTYDILRTWEIQQALHAADWKSSITN